MARGRFKLKFPLKIWKIDDRIPYLNIQKGDLMFKIFALLIEEVSEYNRGKRSRMGRFPCGLSKKILKI